MLLVTHQRFQGTREEEITRGGFFELMQKDLTRLKRREPESIEESCVDTIRKIPRERMVSKGFPNLHRGFVEQHCSHGFLPHSRSEIGIAAKSAMPAAIMAMRLSI